MTSFNPRLFPPAEAERFVSHIFGSEKVPAEKDAREIRQYILSLYHRFLAQRENAGDWTKPLLDFLKELPIPPVSSRGPSGSEGRHTH